MIVRDCCGCCTEWEQEIYLYLDRELSPNGRERVERHLEKCECCARFYRVSEQEEQLLAGRLRHQTEFDFLQEAIAGRVMDGIPAIQPKTLGQRMVGIGRWTAAYFRDQSHRHYALAASLLICVAGILAAMNMSGDIPQNRIHFIRNDTFLPYNAKDPIYVSRAEGESFEFPTDGSVVYATPETIFTVDSYPEKNVASINIGVGRRLTLLSGTLFVDVQPAQEGFSIVNANSEIQVLGTQFLVSVNPGTEKVTTIAVNRGTVRVDIRNDNRSTSLKVREMTHVVNMGKRTLLKSPKEINSDILRMLDRFNAFLSHRDPQRLSQFLRMIQSRRDTYLLPSDPVLGNPIFQEDKIIDPLPKFANIP